MTIGSKVYVLMEPDLEIEEVTVERKMYQNTYMLSHPDRWYIAAGSSMQKTKVFKTIEEAQKARDWYLKRREKETK